MAIKDYEDLYQQLQGLIGRLGTDVPDAMRGFAQLHKGALADGALSKATKELIALGIGIVVRCDGCIAYHVHDALKAGATRQEVLETIGVAVMMGGGPSVVYGCDALTALDEFETAL